MLLPVVVFMLIVLAASAKVKGPIWAFAIAWLVCLVPITTRLIIFSDIDDPHYSYSAILIGYNALFVAGAAVFYLIRQPHAVKESVMAKIPKLRLVWICWVIGLTGSLFVFIDFYLYAGAGLSDLAAIRDAYVEKTSASIYAQIGSILTWACLYCFIFVLSYGTRLGRVRAAILLAPIAGYFLISVFSAGRQTAFQVMLVTGLTMALAKTRRQPSTAQVRPQRSFLTIIGVSTAMIVYMGYVAIARNDGAISDDKTEVLSRLFNFEQSPVLRQIGTIFGSSASSTIVEAVTYFSSSIVLFEKFLTLHWPLTYGATTFPFVMRQLESLTGVSGADVITYRITALNSLGVVGTGWDTVFASYITDFGSYGAAPIIIISGFYSAYAWDRATYSNNFEDSVIGVVVCVAAIYMPISAAISDTNLMLLWLFCLGIKLLRSRPVRIGSRQHLGPATKLAFDPRR